MDYPGFIGSSYQSQAVTADQERTVNWYEERIESPNSTSATALYPTPGVTELSEAATGPGRAHFFMASREFAVIGVTLYEIDENGVQTSRGTVALDANPATISANGDAGGQLFITSGGNGYCYDLTANTLTQVTALNGLATMGDYVDGYFLALNASTGTWYISALYDGTSWTTGTDYAQRSIAPDPWKALKVNGRYIWLFGESTTEIWYNSGGSAFPFQPHTSGGYVHFGIAAPFSVAVRDGTISWLATTRSGSIRACQAQGLAPEVITDISTQRVFSEYATISDAVGDTYQDEGHGFYLINFPKERATWAWDADTRKWHERGTWEVSSHSFDALRTRWHAYAFGEHRWLDSTTGALYKTDTATCTDVDGALVRRIRRAPCIMGSNERIFFAGFELDMEPGLGLTSGQGSDPQVMLRMSNDGGKTWGREMWRSGGKKGAYGTRVRWNRLGSAERRVFEVTVSDPIPWRLTNAYLHFAQAPEGLQRASTQQQREAQA